MSRSARFLDGVLRRLLPEEFADDLVGDLREGYRRRREPGPGGGSGLAAVAWWLREVVSLPYLSLRRQAGRLRAAGVRKEMAFRGGGGVMSALQLRIAVRSLTRRPLHSLVAVLTLVLSVGAGTVVFSILEGVLLRPLPYPHAEQLYLVYGTDASWKSGPSDFMRKLWDRQNVSLAMIASWRKSASGVKEVGAFAPSSVRWDDGGEPIMADGVWVAPGFFTTLGTRPVLGRLPDRDEMTSGAGVVVLGEHLWTSRYGRDPNVVGRTVPLEGRSATIVGVMPADFAVLSDHAQWWAPLPGAFASRTDLAVLRGVVRIAPGVEPATVDTELDAGVESLAASNPSYRGKGAHTSSLRDEVVANVRQGITLIFWAVVAIVLIACVNLMSLVVARAARRRGELALRSALGAGRASLVGATLGETLVLCAVGGGVGLAFARLLLHPLVAFLVSATPGFPRADDIHIDVPVLLFALALTVGTALLAGLVPAWAASKRSPWEMLQEGRRSRGGRGVRRTQRVLLFLESGLAVVLLVGAGLLLRSELQVSAVDPGFDANVAFVEIQPGRDRFPTPGEAHDVGARAANRVATLPGVQAVGRASTLPSLGGARLTLAWRQGEPPAGAARLATVSADSGYFSTLRIPLLEGRTFTSADRADGEPVAVVSQTLARQMFGAESAVGRLLRTSSNAAETPTEADAETVRIVGVVGDVRELALVLDPDALLYRPLAQSTDRNQLLVARGAGSVAHLVEDARKKVSSEDPNLLVSDSGTLDRAVLRPLAPARTRTFFVGVLSTLALVLTLVGIYGVVAYVVSDRTQEIGVRMALGARAGNESSRVVGVALGPVILGGVVGLGGAAALSGILAGALFEVKPLDPVTYGVVLGLLVFLAAAAAWLPARRAAAVDPMRVLNEE